MGIVNARDAAAKLEAIQKRIDSKLFAINHGHVNADDEAAIHAELDRLFAKLIPIFDALETIDF